MVGAQYRSFASICPTSTPLTYRHASTSGHVQVDEENVPMAASLRLELVHDAEPQRKQQIYGLGIR